MLSDEIIRAEAEAGFEWTKAVRRDFHMNPELGFEEFRTQAKICEYLREMNIGYDDKCFATSVIGLIEGNKTGKVIGIRADIDALPIQDEKIVEYKSQIAGKSHACGHDVHMAILLGTAKILAKYREQLPGSVKLLFQPAEETTGGALPMINAGCLENPHVDYTLALHVSADYPVGGIGIKYGQNCASTDEFTIIINGKSAHGAQPQQGIDAIVIAAQLIMALQTIISRGISATDSTILTIGTIRGGDKENIIAEQVVMSGTVRSLTPVNRKKVLKQMVEICEATAAVFGGKAEVQIREGYASLINDTFVADKVIECTKAILGEDKVNVFTEPSLSGEDFAYFTEATPGAMYRLGIANEERGITVGIHNNRFDIDEEALIAGVIVNVKTALELMRA
ncbi:MAG: amidohydrolase [Negativicutes bacterium]